MHIMKKILFVLGIIGFILNVEVCAGQAVSKKNTAVSEKKSEDFLNQKMLNEIESKKNNVIAKLKSSNQKEVDRLFNQYYNEMSEYFYENGNGILNENIRSKSFNKAELNEINSKILNKYGLILEYAGEGAYAVGARPDFYYNIFKDYVSNAYKEYLKITAYSITFKVTKSASVSTSVWSLININSVRYFTSIIISRFTFFMFIHKSHYLLYLYR